MYVFTLVELLRAIIKTFILCCKIFTECSTSPTSDTTVQSTDPVYLQPGVLTCNDPLVVQLPNGDLVETFNTVCGADANWVDLDTITCETGIKFGIYFCSIKFYIILMSVLL